MSRLIFDIETNGLLNQLDRIHVISVMDVATGKVQSFYRENLVDGLDLLSSADQLIAHNGINFDIPAIKKLYPDWEHPEVFDTMVAARLLWADRKEKDMGLNKRRLKAGQPLFPKKLYGKHTLEAWGHRFQLHKGDYAKEMEAKGLDPWAELNDDMVEYCEQDCVVTHRLLQQIEKCKWSPQAMKLEHDVAWILADQMRFGCYFDLDVAIELQAELTAKREKLASRLKETYGWWFKPGKRFTPKRPNRTMGYVKDAPMTKVEVVEFNPNSRQHIADRLMKVHGWKPTEYTEAGNPKLDEAILKELDIPGTEDIVEFLLIQKRIGQIAEGDNAWLKLVEADQRIYGYVNQNGAVTGRATHNNPNLAQVPKVGKPYGKECRSCFRATPGWKFVGADASGLELRCLAHYMARYDDGAYIKTVTEGDVHTENQEAAGLPTRDNAKTFISMG